MSSGGYNLSFLNPVPDALVCLICSYVAKNAHQVNCCGKVFCKSCFERLESKSWSHCPNCSEQFNSFPDARGSHEIELLKVQCEGCQWIGDLSSWNGHLQTCANKPLPCKYAGIGCTKQLRSGQLSAHESNHKQHLHLAVESTLRLSEEVKALEKRAEAPPRKHEHVFKFPSFKITTFRKHTLLSSDLYSPPFCSTPGGYQMCLNVNRVGENKGKETHVSIYIFLMKGNNDNSLTWPFTGTVTVELLNQLEDKNHHKRSFVFQADNKASQRVEEWGRGPSGYGSSKFIAHSELDLQADKNIQYCVGNTQFFRVSVQEPDHKLWLECTV